MLSSLGEGAIEVFACSSSLSIIFSPSGSRWPWEGGDGVQVELGAVGIVEGSAAASFPNRLLHAVRVCISRDLGANHALQRGLADLRFQNTPQFDYGIDVVFFALGERLDRRAMTNRLIDIEPERAVVIRHSQQGRVRFRRTRSVPDRWFPRDDVDAESNAMEVLFGGEERSRRQPIGADAWFFERAGIGDLEVYEQSQKLSNGDILTIVTFKSASMLRD